MNTINHNCPAASSSSQMLPPNTTPLVLFFESTPSPDELASPFKGSMHGGGLPEFTFGTSHSNDVLFVDVESGGDPLDCLSPPDDVVGDVGFDDDDDDDFFSAYIDVKKFEEKEADDDNIAGPPEDNLQTNGGGFVVESGGSHGGRGRRKRKDISKDVIKATPPTKKRQSRGGQSCLATDNEFVEPRKAMAAGELAELWTVDPKRAKR